MHKVSAVEAWEALSHRDRREALRNLAQCQAWHLLVDLANKKQEALVANLLDIGSSREEDLSSKSFIRGLRWWQSEFDSAVEENREEE